MFLDDGLLNEVARWDLEIDVIQPLPQAPPLWGTEERLPVSEPTRSEGASPSLPAAR